MESTAGPSGISSDLILSFAHPSRKNFPAYAHILLVAVYDANTCEKGYGLLGKRKRKRKDTFLMSVKGTTK